MPAELRKPLLPRGGLPLVHLACRHWLLLHLGVKQRLTGGGWIEWLGMEWNLGRTWQGRLQLRLRLSTGKVEGKVVVMDGRVATTRLSDDWPHAF